MGQGPEVGLGAAGRPTPGLARQLEAGVHLKLEADFLGRVTSPGPPGGGGSSDFLTDDRAPEQNTMIQGLCAEKRSVITSDYILRGQKQRDPDK